LSSIASSPRRRPSRIALWGNFGVGNLGNECTLQAMIGGVRRHQPDAVLSCICREPADTRQRHHIAAFPITRAAKRGGIARGRLARRLGFLATEAPAFLAALALMRRQDTLIVAGTGILNDKGEGPLGLPWQIFKWSLAAALTRTRLLFVCVGVEQLASRWSRFFVRASLRLARYRSYRDAMSKQRLLDLGWPVADDPVFPDLAFSLELAPSHGSPAARGVAIGVYDLLRPSPEPGRTVEPAYLQKLCLLTERLLAEGDPVRWVLGDLRYDVPVLEELRRAYRERGVARTPPDEPAPTVDALLAQLAEADLVVVSRFHNLLLSLLLGRPVVSLSYEAKNDALMAEMGLAEYCERIEEFEVESVIRKLLALRRDAPRLRSSILQKAGEFRQALERQYRSILADGGQASHGE
jgi:polysaccharide pyruvyl transferase WcaK-like protein